MKQICKIYRHEANATPKELNTTSVNKYKKRFCSHFCRSHLLRQPVLWSWKVVQWAHRAWNSRGRMQQTLRRDQHSKRRSKEESGLNLTSVYNPSHLYKLILENEKPKSFGENWSLMFSKQSCTKGIPCTIQDIALLFKMSHLTVQWMVSTKFELNVNFPFNGNLFKE